MTTSDKVCEQCGNKLERYCGEYCAHCYDPLPEKIDTFNLIKVLTHLDTKRPGLYDRVWEHMCNSRLIDNDVYKNIYIDPKTLYLDPEDTELLADYQALYDFLGQRKSVVFKISW